jgi:K+-sensing histidine kinase KdpD
MRKAGSAHPAFPFCSQLLILISSYSRFPPSLVSSFASNRMAAVVNNFQPYLRSSLCTLIGVMICAGSAGLMSFIFHGRGSRILLPVAFLAVVLLVSVRCGVAAGILGSTIGALIFATLLYAPLGSPLVANKAARSTLAWIVLGGLSISYLLGSDPGGREHHN